MILGGAFYRKQLLDSGLLEPWKLRVGHYKLFGTKQQPETMS
jgi:hypothetical protein